MGRAPAFWLPLALAMASCSGDARLPPLAQGLDPDVETAQAEFDARVKRRYPVGTSEEALLTDLRRQGFSIRPAFGGLRSADLYRSNYCGRTLWSVRWRVGAARKLTSIFGVYGLQCL